MTFAMAFSLSLLGAASAVVVESAPLGVRKPLPLHIEGTKVVDSNGKPVLLRGVNVACMEWSSDCEGHVLKTVEVAIKVWNCNHIRLPISQDRWFGKAPEQKDGGIAYRALIKQVVELCSTNGAYCMLDLHWNSPNEWGKHIGQHIMPDDHSTEFWLDCAKVFRSHPAVFFDLYNEPHDTTWEIWKNGGEINETRGVGARQGQFTPIKYHTSGMQALVNAVRSTGADNLIVAGGLDWSYDLKGVLEGFALSDPGVKGVRRITLGESGEFIATPAKRVKGNGILYVCHNYPIKGDTFDQWLAKMTRYTEKLPVIMSEFGAQNRGATVNDPNPWVVNVLKAAKDHAWAWTAWDMHPAAGPTLISDWNYTPTPSFGKLVLGQLQGS